MKNQDINYTPSFRAEVPTGELKRVKWATPRSWCDLELKMCFRLPSSFCSGLPTFERPRGSPERSFMWVRFPSSNCKRQFACGVHFCSNLHISSRHRASFSRPSRAALCPTLPAVGSPCRLATKMWSRTQASVSVSEFKCRFEDIHRYIAGWLSLSRHPVDFAG